MGAANQKTTEKCVAFQGERGAYSEMAVHAYFGHADTVVLPCARFKVVFEAVINGEAEYGMLPIENSLAGSVHENYDLLLAYPGMKIIGEEKIRIEHNLIGHSDASLDAIEQIYSHPQALAQCADFIETLENVQRIPFYDTAGSVAHIARLKNRRYAAIASREAAGFHGMKILQAGVESNHWNYTRFFVVCRHDHADPPDLNKVSIVFSVHDRPGALFECLKILADKGINMTKLESRPIRGKPWEYMFYADFRVSGTVAGLETALVELGSVTEDLRMLGAYRQK